MNKVILTGRLTADPELKQTQSGVSVARFTVAVNRPYSKDKDKQEADFISCTAWRNTAEFISRYFSKGDPIEIEGAWRNNNYTDQNGVKHYSADCLVNEVSFTQSKKSESTGSSYSAPANSGYQPPTNNSGYQTPTGNAGYGDLGDFEEILNDGDVPF